MNNLEMTKAKFDVAVLMLLMAGEEDVTAIAVRHLLPQLNAQKRLFLLSNGPTNLGRLNKIIQKNTYANIYIANLNLGVAGGRNYLLQKLEQHPPKTVMLLDNDIIPSSGYIDSMLQFLESDQSHGIVGATVLNYHAIADQLKDYERSGNPDEPFYAVSNLVLQEFAKKHPQPETFFHIGTNPDWENVYIRPRQAAIEYAKMVGREVPKFYESLKEDKEIIYGLVAGKEEKIRVANIAGCTQMFRWTLVEKIGRLDNSFNPYGHEDSDFAIRSIKAGFQNFTSSKIFLIHGTDQRHEQKWTVDGVPLPRVKMLYRGFTILAHKHFDDNLEESVFARALYEYRVHKRRNLYAAAQEGIREGIGILSRNKHPTRKGLFKRTFAEYRSIHKGDRCFVLGNGPSLKKTDLSKLKDEYTFGMNRIYLLFEEVDFRPSYYACVNNLVIRQFAEEICKIDAPKFLEANCRKDIESDTSMHFLKYIDKPGFYGDPTDGLWHSATVTYVSLQIAFFMGFKEVILLGVDHSFAYSGNPNEAQVSQAADPNHFHPDYFGKGIKWNLPDLDTSEIGYAMAKEAFEKDRRRVLDATIDGKLQIFEKVDYGKLFNA